MSGYNNVYMLHSAALNRHVLEQDQPQNLSKKMHPSTITKSMIKGIFSPTPRPFSYNSTPRLPLPDTSCGTPQRAAESNSAHVHSAQKLPAILPIPNPNEIHHQKHKATTPRRNCFSCTRRRLSTSSDDGLYNRPADLKTNSIRYENKLPVSPIYQHEDSIAKIRPTTPNLLPAPKTNESGKRSSLKHPQPRPGWANLPKSPKESLLYSRICESPQAKDMQSGVGADNYSLGSIVSPAIDGISTENTGRAQPNPYTIWRGQEPLGGGAVPEKDVKAMRPGRTGIPLTDISGPRPRDPPRIPPSVNLCDHVKSDQAKELCKNCELCRYYVSCLEWAEVVEQTMPTMQHPLKQATEYGQRSDSPTLGQSATHIRISQPGAKDNGRVTLPVVYPLLLPSPADSEYANPSSPLSEFHYDDAGVLDQEIRDFYSYVEGGDYRSTTDITDTSREQVTLHPAQTIKKQINCMNGMSSPIRLTQCNPEASLPAMNPRQTSQQGIISGIYQHGQSAGSWMDFSGGDSVSESDEGQQDAPGMGERPLTSARLSRPLSSIYNFYYAL